MTGCFLFAIASRPVLGVNPASYLTGTGGSYSGGKEARVWRRPKMTTHHHLVLGLRMHGAIPSLPQYVFMAWCLI